MRSPTDETSTIALRPPGMRVDDLPGFLRIQWRWFSHETVWVTLFCFAFDAAVIYFYRRPRPVRSALVTPDEIIFVLFLIPCIVMTYSALCGYFNSTTIILNRSELVVTRGPLPCGGNRRLSVGDIQRLDSDRAYVQSWLLPGSVRGGARSSFFSGKFEQNRGWMSSLRALMASGSAIQLVGLRTPNVAEFLQFTLEHKLRTLRNASPANIRCPQCRNLIPARDINRANRLGKCESCNTRFPLDDVFTDNRIRRPYVQRVSPSGNIQFVQPVRTIRIGSIRAPRIIVYDLPGILTIQWRWLGWGTILLTFVSLVLDSFLAFWYWSAFTQRGPWFAFIFPIFHALAAIGMTYAALCGYFNSTKVRLSRSELVVRHGPLPCGGGRRVSPNKIKQLYCDQSAGRNGQNSSYGLWANLNAYMVDGTVVQLLRGCSPSIAKLLENKLEEKLGILPQHVTGEYTG